MEWRPLYIGEDLGDTGNADVSTEERVAANVEQGRLKLGRRVAAWSILASALLAAANLTIGLRAGSTSVVAAGLEFAGDVLASTFVLAGMYIAAKPADSNHPYGHGRFETIAGLIVGMILAAGGAGICYRSLQKVGEGHDPPALFAVWPLLGAIVVRSFMLAIKLRVGRRIRSSSLVADAWNDGVDILSAAAALGALGLTLHNPAEFLAADHYGGVAVGVVVTLTGFRVIRDASLELTDTMPDGGSLDEIRSVALRVPGVIAVEKCFARKTGLRYHVDLHLEVDPNSTVWESHAVAKEVRTLLSRQLDWIADVLIHVEPAPGIERRKTPREPPIE